MKIHDSVEVINELEKSISENLPFSLIRFGDGGLKLITRYVEKKSLFSISRREGIPILFFDQLITYWRKYANEANYIDSPEVYISETIFKKRRKVTDNTRSLMYEWREIYKSVGIINERFCNPEIGYLLFSENAEKNILELISNKRVCCITNFYEAKKILSRYVGEISLKLIPGFFGNFYNVCYESIVSEIKKEANNYDLWLIGAGELGRVFSGMIKEYGGRSIDIGKIFDVIVNKKINKRMKKIVRFSNDHELLLTIGDESETYK